MATRAATSDPEGMCGKCGYLVKGLTTFTCPECGSDLRQVGIIRPRSKAAGRPSRGGAWAIILKASAWRLALWVAGCLIFIAIIAPLIRDYVWPFTSRSENVIHAFPKSHKYTAVDFYTKSYAHALGRLRAVRAPPQSRYGRMTVQDGGNSSILGIDYLANNHSYTDASGQTVTHPGLPTAATVLDFLKVNHVDTSDPQVQAEADAAATMLSAAATWPSLKLNQPSGFPFDVSTWGSSVDVLWEGGSFRNTENIAWPLLIVTGMVVIVWRRRRALRAAGVIAAARFKAPTAAAAPPPPSDRPARTLTILFSDIKDYTARAAAGSRQAVMDLVRRHRELAQPIVKRHGGRIVKTIGDALLMTFDSATDAVLAGLEIQNQLDGQNKSAGFAEALKLDLRIAVSSGEVIVEDGDVYGEPVNLASRLQQHAVAGEVLFSESTRVLINRQEVRAEEAGTFELKGVPGAVRAWRAVREGAGTATADRPAGMV